MTRWLAAILAIVLAPTGTSLAADHFLTIGGGYSPTGNQVSLEKNVQFFKRVLNDRYASGVPHDIFFSDGSNPGRDLQYAETVDDLPRANVLLARIFKQTKYLGNRYRSHELQDINGGSTRANLARWFQRQGAALVPGDRLIIYVTAHGGKATDKKKPRDTALYLWNGEKLMMHELADHIRRLPKGVAVVTVMVQCYSGGFMDLLFEAGDEAKGLTDRPLCGFFATVHDRVAAGCTPDINEENYHEYSSSFWAALMGQTRTGQPLKRPDFDVDGHVSFAEAHAYTLINSPTIDISVQTSDRFLRKYSVLNPPAKTQSSKTDAPQTDAPQTDAPQTDAPQASAEAADADVEFEVEPEWWTVEVAYSDILTEVSPVQRAILEGLSEKLGLEQENRIKAARDLASRIQRDQRRNDAQLRQKRGEQSRLADQIARSIKVRWPELSNRWDPVVGEILADENEELVRAIERHSRFRAYESARKQVVALSDKKLDLDRRWVKCQRLIRAIENAVLAHNLPLVAGTEQLSRYEQLLKLEQGRLGPDANRNDPRVTSTSDGDEE